MTSNDTSAQQPARPPTRLAMVAGPCTRVVAPPVRLFGRSDRPAIGVAMVVRHRLPVFAFCVVLLLAACAPSAPSQTGTPASDTKADGFAPGAARARFAGFAGGQGFTLPDDLRGRPLVLNAWASWCGSCRREMPEFQTASSTRSASAAPRRASPARRANHRRFVESGAAAGPGLSRDRVGGGLPAGRERESPSAMLPAGAARRRRRLEWSSRPRWSGNAALVRHHC